MHILLVSVTSLLVLKKMNQRVALHMTLSNTAYHFTQPLALFRQIHQLLTHIYQSLRKFQTILSKCVVNFKGSVVGFYE